MAITIKINNNYNTAYNVLQAFEPDIIQPNPYENVFVGNLTDEQFGVIYCSLARNRVNFDWRITW